MTYFGYTFLQVLIHFSSNPNLTLYYRVTSPAILHCHFCLNYFIKKGWSSFLIRKWHDADSWKIMLVSLFDSSKLHLSWHSSDLFVCKKYMSLLREFYYYLFIYIWPVKKKNKWTKIFLKDIYRLHQERETNLSQL